MKERFVLFLTVFFILIAVQSFAETIILNTGEKVEGVIKEMYRDSLKIDVNGIELTYYLKDVDEIDGQKVDHSGGEYPLETPAPVMESNQYSPQEENIPTEIQPGELTQSLEAAQPPLESEVPPIAAPETMEPVKEPVY